MGADIRISRNSRREGALPMLELIGLIVVLWFLWEKIIGA